MDRQDLIKKLAIATDSKILFLIFDGLGGLGKDAGNPATELETASTPNLDKLAAEGACGLMDPVFPGITPGSGPAHLSLFGYDPLRYDLGRGILSAYGIRCFQEEEPLNHRNVAARMNFATLEGGKVTDRRAGRIADDVGKRLVALLARNITEIDGVKVTVEHEKEYRGALILEGDGLSGALIDTDPGRVGEAPHDPAPAPDVDESEAAAARKTAAVVKKFVEQVKELLKDEHPANFCLLRGFDGYRQLPSLQETYRLNPAAVAAYPMYRGVSRLLGMKVLKTGSTVESELETLQQNVANHDYFFFHVKKTDSYGEDGNFDAKVGVIEQVDALVPDIRALGFDTICVTGDHSTPCVLKSHSWHPLPLIVWSKVCRRDGVTAFGEQPCAVGGLGRINALDLMPLALANAGKLVKYGA